MPLTILIVDDDPAIRIAINDYLEASGYSTITAGNGKEALAILDKYQPQLIVTDIIMPQMDGYALVRQVRQNPAMRLLPVIFLTARNKTEERIQGYRLGCDAYLPKPFELDELGAVIRNLLERSLIESALHGRPTLPREEEGGTISPSRSDTLTGSISIQNAKLAKELTPREREVLELLAHGLSNPEMGDRLHLSPRTVEKYVSSLLRKTDTSNRAELVRFAMEHQLVEWEGN